MDAALGIRTTLPQIWESEQRREAERVIARCACPLVSGGTGDKQWAVDAFPAEEAQRFTQWVAAQVFISKARELYIECDVYQRTVELAGVTRDLFILAPSSNTAQVCVALGSIPLSFFGRPPQSDVLRRAAAARENPQSLLSPIALARWEKTE
jgi:hypothetical protein